MNNIDWTARIVGLMLLSCVCWARSYAQTSEDNWVQQLEEEAKAAASDSIASAKYFEIAKRYGSNDYVKAAEYGLLALARAQRTDSYVLETQSLGLLGEIYFSSGRRELAVDVFTKYIAAARRVGNEKDIAMGYFNLGSVWLVLGNLEKAETYMRKIETEYVSAAESMSAIIDTSTLLALYNNMIFISNEKEEWSAGTAYFEKGVKIGESLKSSDYVYGTLFVNYGDLLVNNNQYPEAIETYNMALEQFSELGEQARIGLVLSSLGAVYEKVGQRKKSLDMYMQSYRIAIETKNDPLIAMTAERIADYYQLESKPDSTLKYMKIVQEVDARLKTMDANEKLVSNELLWQFQEQERKLEANHRHKIIRLVLILVGEVMVLIFIIVLAYRYRRRFRQARLEKYNIELGSKQLALEKELLRAQIEVKDKQLTTEVMYRIKNHELIKSIVSQLLSHRTSAGHETREVIGSVVRNLENSMEDQTWEEFEKRFEQVHTGFYSKLQDYCPTLSLNERRLCAFLRLNMTTKEISAITGQTVNSIEVARTRLRKKLGIQGTDVALVSFISGL